MSWLKAHAPVGGEWQRREMAVTERFSGHDWGYGVRLRFRSYLV